MKRNNIIEVNGKRYDALTGKLLSDQKMSMPNAPARNSIVDGVMRPRKTGEPRQHHPAQRKPEKSTTLMRQAVKKPSVVHKSVIVKPEHIEQSAPAAHHPAGRVQRAARVPKSTLISRFGSPVTAAVHAKVDHVPVQIPPAIEPQPIISTTTLQHAASPFQHALERATSHMQPKPRKTRPHHKVAGKLGIKPRTVSIAASALSVLLIAGFIAYQNVPNVAMRVAAARAGVQGGMPGYQPSGFSLAGPIKYAPGQITISYRSNSDERAFDVVQRATEWNSDALLREHVAVGRRPYQTYQEEGKTIYLYDGNNATWVDRGTWYEIKGEAALNSDQLLRMAKSL